MLPRHHRLRLDREFQQVYRQGRSWAHPYAALHVLAQPDGQRVGISVSKKVGRATGRNRVRRRLREILRAQLPGWKTGFDAVIVARAGAAGADFSQLSEAISELARRSRLVREPDAPPDTPYIMPAGGRPGRGARPAGVPADPAAR